MRGRNSLKSNTCTGRAVVYAAGMSGKVARLTLGDLVACSSELSAPRGGEMGSQKSADAVVGVTRHRWAEQVTP
mgnify:CR=1 FL=1